MADYHYDACFLACPLPVLKAQKILKQMRAGEQLAILVSDFDQVSEFEFFCKNSENTYVTSEKLSKKIQNHDIWRVFIQK